MKRTAIILFLLMFLLTGCNPLFSSQTAPTPIPISSILINKGADFQPTLTPFQPIPPTPTQSSGSSPLSTSVPTKLVPQQYSTLDNSNVSQAADRVNILIMGSDDRGDGGFRTDVLMLLSLDPSKGTATLTSFPRDLYINIPGVGMERINTAQEYGGFELTTATFQNNFGITPNYYMMTNFSGFKGIIDTLGGIDVNAATNFKDECSVRSRVDGMGYCTINAGVNHMDGETALWYVRSRYSTDDFDRTRRAQEVLTAIFQKLISLNGLNRAAELYKQFNSSVETNIPLSEIVSLLPLARQLASNRSLIRRYAIGESDTYYYIVPGSGAMVLVPYQNAVMSIIQQALN